MFIVRSIGSDDEEHPFKIFTSKGDAQKYAEDRAKQNVERVLVYEWAGDDWQEGLAAARKGQLEPILHYSHRATPAVPPPRRPHRLSKEMEEWLNEKLDKLPKIARKWSGRE